MCPNNHLSVVNANNLPSIHYLLITHIIDAVNVTPTALFLKIQLPCDTNVNTFSPKSRRIKVLVSDVKPIKAVWIYSSSRIRYAIHVRPLGYKYFWMKYNTGGLLLLNTSSLILILFIFVMNIDVLLD